MDDLQNRIWQILAGLLSAAIIAIAASTIQNSNEISVSQAAISRLHKDIDRLERSLGALENLYYWGNSKGSGFYDFYSPEN